ncbi:holin [Jeotgalibacillus soli]|nr:holin [Jeotgalibacillus soli]
MVEVLVFATVLAPIVLAVVELLKRSGPIKKNYIPLIAFAVGIFIGFAASPFTDLDTVLRLWAGGFAGLSATGLFEIGNKRTGYTIKEDEE